MRASYTALPDHEGSAARFSRPRRAAALAFALLAGAGAAVVLSRSSGAAQWAPPVRAASLARASHGGSMSGIKDRTGKISASDDTKQTTSKTQSALSPGGTSSAWADDDLRAGGEDDRAFFVPNEKNYSVRVPTGGPTLAPTGRPSGKPSAAPSYVPTVEPSLSHSPTPKPSEEPTMAPTTPPSPLPTVVPTYSPR